MNWIRGLFATRKFFPSTRTCQNRRSGLTIIELTVVIAILGIMAAVIVSTSGGSGTSRSDQDRINEIAKNLDDISRAIAFFEPTKSGFSFKQTVGLYPERLSQLSQPITPSQRNSCGTFYTAQDTSKWIGNYYIRELPTSGFNLGPGFVSQDPLVRNPATAPEPQGPFVGTLAIVIPNVTLLDAELLDRTVDEVASENLGTVRYAPVSSTPVTVSYLTSVGKC